MNITEITATLRDWIWSMPFICFCLATGLYFSWKMRFLQLRYIKEMVTMLFTGKSSSQGISSFQAFNLALAGRVGTGNIAGVATAIALGGPGAVFWMWAIAFLGACSSFVESSLAQVYKENIDGNYRGGPAYYILKGLRNKPYAIVFAVATVLSMGLLLPGVQSNAIGLAVQHSFSIDVRISAGIVVALLALIIYGGVKRIARVAEIVTPFMAMGYILLVIVILAFNYQYIPGVFALIFKSAFGFDQALGGMIGSAVSMGVKRGIFSNEAGQGSAPHAAAAAEVPHPAKQGLVQAFSVYVDTILVCSATALVILVTGTYRVIIPGTSPEQQVQVVYSGHGMPESIPVAEYGPVNTQLAIDSIVPGFGSGFVAVALFLFAFTTIMNYYFQAETNLYFLFRKKKTAFYMIHLLRIAMLAVTFFAAINTMTLAWNMADIGFGTMAWLNLIAILLLRKVAFKVFKDFETQYKSGIKDPVFHPRKLGIEDAEVWESTQ